MYSCTTIDIRQSVIWECKVRYGLSSIFVEKKLQPEGESAAAASGAGLWQIFLGKVRYGLSSIFVEKLHVQLHY